jgi:response regulator RpfG family c-di-GMP phosphodiesterase
MGIVSNWVFKPNAMQLLQQLRKRVKAEFGFTLRFNEEQLVEQLARVKRKTVDATTRSIVADIEQMRGATFNEHRQASALTYRGQTVIKEQPKKKDIYQMIYGDELHKHSKTKSGKSQRMYRGAPISGD